MQRGTGYEENDMPDELEETRRILRAQIAEGSLTNDEADKILSKLSGDDDDPVINMRKQYLKEKGDKKGLASLEKFLNDIRWGV